jgi:hypothetical protein
MHLTVPRRQVGECRRIAKGGREVWLQANYSPVLGADGTILEANENFCRTLRVSA